MRKNDTKNLSEKAYEYICARLSSGDLKPGDRLSEPSLAAACGVSRTPMREAVRRLVEEGVLYQKTKSGTYISGVAAKDVVDAYAIRSAIESAMLVRAMRNITPKDITVLQGHCDRMHSAIKSMRRAKMDVMTGRPESQFIAEDLAFHLLLLRISGNTLAEKIIANTYRRNQFFGTHSHQRTLRHVAIAWRYHCEILKACRRRDADDAVRWLKAHLAYSEKDALLPLMCFR
jgi:DNA-binding GntR family transcriptional regulator